MQFPIELSRNLEQVATLDQTKIVVSFYRSPDLPTALSGLQSAGLEAIGSEDHQNFPFNCRFNHADRKIWARGKNGSVVALDQIAKLKRIFQDNLEWIGPVYHLDRGDGGGDVFCPFPSALLVKLNVDENRIALDLEREFDLTEDLEKSGFFKLIGYRCFSLKNPRDNDVFAVREQIAMRLGLHVSDVKFENMPLESPFLTYIPNDPRYGEQWAPIRIKAGGVPSVPFQDISGWNYSKGSPDIVIAVIDSGCDLNHPDLLYASLGYNAGFKKSTGAPNPNASGFVINHGTLVAGVAAAVIDNDYGVSGIAGRCKILPIALENATDWELLFALAYAFGPGKANVINMSFRMNSADEDVVNPYLEEAYRRGVILCAASGNRNMRLVDFPGRYPRVICVGASDQNDVRIVRNNWGSNFGPGLDMVAPGIDILTTNYRVGGGPFLQPEFDLFWGTSAAVPHVSGLAALILSVRNDLEPSDVYRIMAHTCDKIGPDMYVLNKITMLSRNDVVGHGRINVARALEVTAEYPGSLLPQWEKKYVR